LEEKKKEEEREKLNKKIIGYKWKVKERDLQVKIIKDTCESLQSEVAGLRDIIKSEVMSAEIEQMRKRQGANTEEEEEKEEKARMFRSLSENPMFSTNLVDIQALMSEMEAQ